MLLYLSLIPIPFLGACSSGPAIERERTAMDGFTVEYLEYPAAQEAVRPLTVILLPPTGGINTIDRSYAKAFARRGAKVLVMTAWSGQFEQSVDLGIHQRLHEYGVRGVQLLLETIPKDHSISVLGTSLGGLFASIAAYRFDSIDRVLVIGAGAPIPQLIADSEQAPLVELRAKREDKFGFRSRAEYKMAIEKNFSIDPLSHKRPEAKELGMVVLLEDETVGTTYQLKLKEFWQPKFVVERQNSHFWGIVNTWLHNFDEVVEFVLKGSPTKKEK